jgi:uncharacterized membrane protein YdbT with pleckstrin-like domain
VEDVRCLDPKVKVIWLSPLLLVAGIFTLLGFAAYLVVPPEVALYGVQRNSIPLLVLALDALACIPVYIYSELVYRNFTFTLTDTNILVRQGVITRKSTIIPYVAIQDITSERSLLERLLGIATIEIETAGSSRLASETYIPGIANKDALIAEIMAMVNAAKSAHAEREGQRPLPSAERILLAILRELRRIGESIGKPGKQNSNGGPPSAYEQYERFKKEK